MYGSAESEEEHSQAAQPKRIGVPLMRDDSAFESEYTKVSDNPRTNAAKRAVWHLCGKLLDNLKRLH